MELVWFMMHLIAIEEMRAGRFQEGLQQKIWTQVACLQVLNFQHLVELVSIVECECGDLVVFLNGQKWMTHVNEGSNSISLQKFVLRMGM